MGWLCFLYMVLWKKVGRSGDGKWNNLLGWPYNQDVSVTHALRTSKFEVFWVFNLLLLQISKIFLWLSVCPWKSNMFVVTGTYKLTAVTTIRDTRSNGHEKWLLAPLFLEWATCVFLIVQTTCIFFGCFKSYCVIASNEVYKAQLKCFTTVCTLWLYGLLVNWTLASATYLHSFDFINVSPVCIFVWTSYLILCGVQQVTIVRPNNVGSVCMGLNTNFIEVTNFTISFS